MKRQFAGATDLLQYFNTNRTEYKDKAAAFMDDIVQLNRDMNYDDLATIVSPEFHDDIHSDMSLDDLLDKHYMTHLEDHSRESFIALHDFYNR